MILFHLIEDYSPVVIGEGLEKMNFIRGIVGQKWFRCQYRISLLSPNVIGPTHQPMEKRSRHYIRYADQKIYFATGLQ